MGENECNWVKIQMRHIPNAEEASECLLSTNNDAYSTTKYGFLVQPDAQIVAPLSAPPVLPTTPTPCQWPGPCFFFREGGGGHLQRGPCFFFRGGGSIDMRTGAIGVNSHQNSKKIISVRIF